MYTNLIIASPRASEASRIIKYSARNLNLWTHQKAPQVTIYPMNGMFNTYGVLKRNVEYILNEGNDPTSILVAYFGHGEEHALVGDESIIGRASGFMLTTNHDVSFLEGTSMVAIACLSGKTLGPYLKKNGIRKFIGFTEEIFVDRSVSRYKPGYKTKRVTEDAVDIYTYMPKALLLGETRVTSNFRSYLNKEYPGNEIAEVAARSVVEY